MHLLLLVFCTTLPISAATALLALHGASSNRGIRRRLLAIQESMQATAAALDGVELERAQPWGGIDYIDGMLERFRFARSFRQLTIHADSSLTLGAALLIAAAFAAVFAGASYLLLHVIVVAVLCGAVGATAPQVYLRFRRWRRIRAFNDALPEAIDLMARSLQAGHAVGASIEMIADHSPQPLAAEFMQVFQQQRLGLQFRDALLQMGARVPSRDLHFLITAILVQKETGGDLTEILFRTSHVIRERVRIEGDVRTRTAQGRLTGWILSLLPLVLLGLINLVSPGYSNILFTDPTGQKLLMAGGVLIVIGALSIRKVVDVKV